MGRRISEDYRGEKLTVVGILKGAFMFLADLIRELDMDVEVEFMQVSSYGNETRSSGNIMIKKDLEISAAGKNILIVDDIIDSGNTLKYLKETYLAGKGAKSVRVATFLDKPSRRTVAMQPDYTGFQIDDLFVIGYGLDYAQQFRQLPYIAYLTEKSE
jgi:hypoxanthine phosphoribosyltransferase